MTHEQYLSDLNDEEPSEYGCNGELANDGYGKTCLKCNKKIDI